MRRVERASFGSALAAAALVVLSTSLPLWSMTMKAPQYPKGLRLDAYGTRMVGGLRGLNLLNHYIGLPPIAMPELATTLYPVGIVALATLCLLARVHRHLRRLAIAALALTPVVMLADLQRWLYVFGHSLDPRAPIRLKPFTPIVIGTSTMGNFQSWAMVGSGVLCLAAAVLVLMFSDRVVAHFRHRTDAIPAARRRAAVAALTTLMLGGSPGAIGAQSLPLQQRLLAATPGST